MTIARRGPPRKTIDELRDRTVGFKVNERDLALLRSVQQLRRHSSQGATLRILLEEEHARLEAEDAARKRQPAPRKPIPHGTFSGYQYHSCRCDDCRTAHNEYHAQYRERRRREKLAGGYAETEL